MRLSASPAPLAMASHPTQRGRNRVDAMTQPQQTAKLVLGTVVLKKHRPRVERDLRDDLADLLADRTFLQGSLPRSEQEFQERLRDGLRELPAVVYDVTKLVNPLLKAYHEAMQTIEATSAPNMQRS